MEKAEVRHGFAALRRAIPAASRASYAKLSQRALLADPVWQAARQVTLYMPIRAEVDTALLLAEAWARKVEVLLPRCRPGFPGMMDFVPCTAQTPLRPGSWGILEALPEYAALPWAGPLCPDVAVVPALAFDQQGFRLGYGGGYYDRALAHACFARTKIVGLCYRAQCVAHVPTDAWDCPVHALCTEEGLQWL